MIINKLIKKNYEARLSNNSILKGETKKNKKQRKKFSQLGLTR